MIVAIDGPAGAGKSSVARGVADALGYTYLNSGSMYRAVGLLTLRDGGAASEHAEALDIQLGDRVLVNGEDVTDDAAHARRVRGGLARWRPTRRCALRSCASSASCSPAATGSSRAATSARSSRPTRR